MTQGSEAVTQASYVVAHETAKPRELVSDVEFTNDV